MENRLKLLLLAGSVVVLPACVPMMALSAANMLARTAQGAPQNNQGLQPQAREACTALAAQHGTVHVIDVEQARVDKIIVWGTVDDGRQRRSFQCDFGRKVTGFTLREINPQR